MAKYCRTTWRFFLLSWYIPLLTMRNGTSPLAVFG